MFFISFSFQLDEPHSSHIYYYFLSTGNDGREKVKMRREAKVMVTQMTTSLVSSPSQVTRREIMCCVFQSPRKTVYPQVITSFHFFFIDIELSSSRKGQDVRY